MVHGLELAENGRRLLREAWRVLKDDGRLLIVVPNRSGLWAYRESTPFGHGLPYSTGQLGRLLAGGLFRIERRDAALWMPPSRMRVVLRSGGVLERAGRRMMPGLAGVTLTEAVKDVYAAIPLQAAPRRRLVLADAA
jgi:SAM-dependent methyltransferase